MKNLLALILLFTISLTSNAQEDTEVDDYSVDVKKCITSNGTMTYYEGVMEQMYTMLEGQFKTKNVPKNVWTEVKKGKKPAMDELAQINHHSSQRNYCDQC